MAEVQVIARYKVSPGRAEEVMALIAELVKASRLEPGCRSFEVLRQWDDESRVVLLERYRSREAFEEHRASEHFSTYVLSGLVPRLDSRVVEDYDVPQD